LGSVSDITAVSYLFNIEGVLYFFNDYYLPEDSLNTSINMVSFKQAGEKGDLIITPGNVADYKYILRDILDVREWVNITVVNYDKFNSTQFIIEATEAGLECRPFSQMPGNLNKPVKEFERRIKSAGIRIERNSLTRWMFSNVLLITNRMGNVSLDRASRSKKIDGIAAMCNSLGGLMDNPVFNFEIN